MSEKKKGQEALNILQKMWKQSNTEEKILQAIKDKYGEEIYRVLRRGQFILVKGVWVILLSQWDYEEYISIPGREFFIELEDWKIKPWTGDLSAFYRKGAIA